MGAAEYIIKSEPSPNSAYYGSYLPTYYGDVIHWEDAEVIDLIQNTDGLHLHLIAVSTAVPGPGSISGQIEVGTDNPPAANIPIVLKNLATGEFQMTYSDTQGNFSFTGLFYGAYEIFAEVMGKSVTPLTLVLHEDHQSQDDV